MTEDYRPDPKAAIRVVRTDVLKDLGTAPAFVLETFRNGVELAMKSSSNFKEGRSWYYHSIEQICNYHTQYSEKTIRQAIKLLVDRGVLLKANYNKNKYNRTYWYAFKNEDFFFDGDALKARDLACGKSYQMDENLTNPMWNKLPDGSVPKLPDGSSTKLPHVIDIDIKESNLEIVIGGEVSPQDQKDKNDMGTLAENMELMKQKQVNEKARQAKKKINPTRLFKLVHEARAKYNPSMQMIMPSPKAKDLGLCNSLIKYAPTIVEDLDLLSEHWSSFTAYVNALEGTEYHCGIISLPMLVKHSDHIGSFALQRRTKADMLKQKEAEYDAKLATKKKKALSKPAEVVLKTNSHYFKYTDVGFAAKRLFPSYEFMRSNEIRSSFVHYMKIDHAKLEGKNDQAHDMILKSGIVEQWTEKLMEDFEDTFEKTVRKGELENHLHEIWSQGLKSLGFEDSGLPIEHIDENVIKIDFEKK